MKLDALEISDYGPLRSRLEFSDGVNIIHGPNESGKTLLVDALLLFLLDANPDDRVGQHPSGFIKIQEDDAIRRLETDETILDRFKVVHDIELQRQEFRDTFIIRGADSTLTDEDEYYNRATDIVAESLVEDIITLRTEVANRGRITSGDRLLWNRQTDGYVRNHHNKATELFCEITETIRDARENDIPSIEAELYRAETALEQQQAVVEELEQAEEVTKFESTEANLETLETTLGELEDLPKKKTLAALEDDAEEALAAKTERSALETRQQRANRLALRATFATGIATVLALIIGSGVLLSLSPSFTGIVAVGLAALLVGLPSTGLSVYFWYQQRSLDDDLASVSERETTTLTQARATGIKIESIEELTHRLDTLREHRSELEARATELHGRLQTALDIDTDSPRDTLETGRDRLDARRETISLDINREYSAPKLEQARKDRDEAKNRVKQLDAQLEETRDEINRLASAAIDIPFEQYDLTPPATDIQSIDGLERVADRLAALVKRIETDADNARAAMDALDRVERSERSEVEDLFFGAESEVSQRFAQITDGRYEAVNYDEGTNELRLRRETGTTLTPEQLSQSTFDQLYFAVRTAFAQQMLDDVAGFLVLDDAFLAADSKRLERQVAILDELAECGWQVVYLTAKADTREIVTAVTNAASSELAVLEH